MADPNDPNLTADISAVDPLEAGLAAAFGPATSPTSAGESVLASLRHTYGELRPVMLRDADGESGHVVRPHTDAMPDLHETGARYQISGEIARGGMGAVLRGRDVDLGRDLAVKVLLEKYSRKPDVARRFLEEAQVGAQLQHPGIVPVYDIGRFGDRPFFTMKLVKGRTLSALLAERGGPSDDLARFLGIFLQVAQTLAYAHAKGVIHRDLKPANIMVGAFGEVQVMDWGLAKVLTEGGIVDEARATRGREPPENPTIIRTARSGSAGSFGTDTEAGSLLGTPAYMPPEQANGDVELLDRRADVFGLGAILCETLSGQPPYVGRSAEEVRRMAANGDQSETHSRLDASGADGELLALAKSCLAPEPTDRPRDAQAVAEAVDEYLNGVQERLRKSEIERAEAIVKASEERKRRRVQLALAACVLGMWLLGGAGVWWWRERRSEANRGVEAALAEAKSLQQQGRWPDAMAAARRAEVLLPGADQAPASQVATTIADLRMLTSLEQAPLTITDRRQDANDYAGADEGYAAAFREYGVDVMTLEPAAAADRLRGSAIREAIAVSLDAWAGVRFALDDKSGQIRLLQVAQALDDDPWRQRFRKIRLSVASNHLRADVQALAQDSGITRQPAICLVVLAHYLRNFGDPALAAELIQQAQRRHPDDLNLAVELAICRLEQNPPKTADAIRYYTAAEALRPNSALIQNALGRALHRDGQLAEAEALFRRAVEIDPDYSWTYINLGRVLDDQKRRGDAVAAFQKAFDLRPNSPQHWSDFGMAMRDQKLVQEAEVLARKATQLWPDDARGWQSLGAALGDQAAAGRPGKLPEAVAVLKKAIVLNPNLAFAHFDLGKALARLKKPDEAEPELRRAAELLPSVNWINAALAYFYFDQKRPKDAAVALRRFLEQNPNDLEHWNLLARSSSESGDWDASADAARRVIALDPANAAAHRLLGRALLRNRALPDAVAALQRAVDLNPKDAEVFVELGDALTNADDSDRALAAYRGAFDLVPHVLGPGQKWIAAMHRFGRLSDVPAIWKKALAFIGNDPDAWFGYAELNLILGRDAEYRWACMEMLRRFGNTSDPGLAERTSRACMLLPTDGATLEQAVALADRAFDSDPKYEYYAFIQLAKGLAEFRSGRFESAIDLCRQVESRNTVPATCRCIIALAQHALGHSDDARRTLLVDLEDLFAGAMVDEWVYCALRREANLAILPHFKDFLEGRYTPSENKERRQFVIPCYFERRYRRAADLAAARFNDDPSLLDDSLQTYNAACFSALAGNGKGKDAPADDAERARLRRNARDMLKRSLTTLQRKSGAQTTQVLNQVRTWRNDSDLAGVRGDAIAYLPADEQADWRELWSDVADLLKKAESP